ncbi:hypothetical protein PAECIP111891_03952 [Paenibacillus allorhizoplanae]|uniref:GNAT family N-acetyltransferase n=1 Tax=Paenibacillus allorhizoplanae TaxID=2905648 RepID=A0ABN8GS97_9BACL|nr:hypothetical protein [Paenibacillus allorhizoplanae]CAH1213332.1 hypothetical protein PAECIP111891_03952 [Paenibacillus allorhizoplanae]
MTLSYQKCVSDDDFAKASLFMLARKRDLHPAYSTLEMVTLIYSYVTQGHLIAAKDVDDRVVGIAAYYYGTPEQDFQDKDIAFVDVAIADKALRGSRLFVRGLLYMVNEIVQGGPEVQELRLAALAENDYICRLYAKFTSARSVREGTHGKEVVFCEKINILRDTLKKFTAI